MSAKTSEYLPGTVLECLKGQRLVMRPFVREDADRRARWPAYEQVEQSNLNVDLSTEVRRAEWFRQRSQQRGPFWFALENETGELIGEQTLRDIDPVGKSARLGIHLSPACLDRGYGTEAVRLMMRYVFERLHYQELVLDVAAWNRRAIRCYEKCGFRVKHAFWRSHALMQDVLSDPRCAHLRPYVRIEQGLEVMKHWEMGVTLQQYREMESNSDRSGRND